MSFDAASVGNHEFDHGAENMVTQLKKATIPVLLGNVFYEDNGKAVWDKPYIIVEKEGVKFGVIDCMVNLLFMTRLIKINERVLTRDEVEYLNKIS